MLSLLLLPFPHVRAQPAGKSCNILPDAAYYFLAFFRTPYTYSIRIVDNNPCSMLEARVYVIHKQINFFLIAARRLLVAGSLSCNGPRARTHVELDFTLLFE